MSKLSLTHRLKYSSTPSNRGVEANTGSVSVAPSPPKAVVANHHCSSTSSPSSGWNSEDDAPLQSKENGGVGSNLEAAQPTPTIPPPSQTILSEIYDIDTLYDDDPGGDDLMYDDDYDLPAGDEDNAPAIVSEEEDDGFVTDDEEQIDTKPEQNMEEEVNEDVEVLMQEGEPSPQQQEQQQQQVCKVCGLDISSMHYLRQVAHVKQCMAGKGASKTRPPPPYHPAVPVLPATNLLAMDVNDWLKALDLDQHIDVFIQEEIDMSIVHALTDDDLRSIGLGHSTHRKKILDAAKLVKAEIVAAQQAKQRPPPAPRLVQQQLNIAGGHHQQGLPPPGQQQPHPVSLNALRSTELTLLQSLYPSTANGSLDVNNYRPTPALPERCPAIASTGAPQHHDGAMVVTPSRSLWTSAAECREVTSGLDARLLQRHAARDPQQVPQGLHRGGISYAPPSHGEDRATKLVKLEALRGELSHHEGTVAHLREMVQQLEKELGYDLNK